MSLKALHGLNLIIQNLKIQHNNFVLFLSKITDRFHICIVFEKVSIVICSKKEILFKRTFGKCNVAKKKYFGYNFFIMAFKHLYFAKIDLKVKVDNPEFHIRMPNSCVHGHYITYFICICKMYKRKYSYVHI